MASRRTSRPTKNEPRILVRSEHPQGAYAARVLRTWAREFLGDTTHFPPSAELSIVLQTDRAIRRLNREWRGKDSPTDVLSFEQDPSMGLLGDVVISLDTAKRQAKEGGRPLTEELARLLAHGMLHLVGHDHEKPAEAKRMARAEIAVLGRVGMVAEAFGAPAELQFHRAPGPSRSTRAKDTATRRPRTSRTRTTRSAR